MPVLLVGRLLLQLLLNPKTLNSASVQQPTPAATDASVQIMTKLLITANENRTKTLQSRPLPAQPCALLQLTRGVSTLPSTALMWG